jgi:two-component system, sensor histidine kinase and response regulator
MNPGNFALTGSPSVLIVDDNSNNLQVLGKLLQENSFKIEFATNGETALAWLEKKLFDIILLDINMPGMNGFEVCSKIRSNRVLDNVPVIFLSAETDRESILKGFELGAQDYVTKPFDSRELLSRVGTHLKLKSSLENLSQLNQTLEDKVVERTEQLQDALAQVNSMNIKLTELDKVKSEFLHLVSHEIRTPLNGIIGPLELIKEDTDTTHIAELLNILDVSVKRLEHFSYNALLITRLKTRSGEIDKEKKSFSEILQEVIKENEDLSASHNILFKFNVHCPDPNVNVETDLVKKCLGNIIDNAINNSPENGVIEITLYDEGNDINCMIRDSGEGFTERALESAFDLFSMGDTSKDDSPGMGLALSRMIMDAHNGKIIIGNNKDGGAFVKVVFPRN